MPISKFKAQLIAELKAGNYELVAESLLAELSPKGDLIDAPSKVWNFLRKFTVKRQEHFICLSLNNKNVVLSTTLVSVGTVSETIVHPREIFRKAIEDGASSIIISHNHPSGVLTPSREDIEVTKRLVECGKILGIRLVDHVIISKQSFFSMREERFID